MRRKWLLLFFLFAVFILLAMVMPKPSAGETCKSFLTQKGYETDAAFSEEEVTLPDAADTMWKAYLLLQRENGFDMEPYCGRKVLKYTFSVLNYPFKAPVYANVYWANGKIIGGDIMSPALDGFMHGISFDLL